TSVLGDGIETCVVEIPDAKKGATIVAAITQPIDESEVKSQLKDLLPALAMPKHFMLVEELPKMGSGKIDFRTTTNLVQERL
ncbi:MAG: bifunctional acyl-ACP--phospholipid O-acyltransferase/long-chain-fatty-acid--ACP ligase, partial [Gammaproteobacteria bacterium]|nr:bifunctional acyl-ACP--phospholipid O-acyltransferase/long-chain-fatty-acid--ACP ligase [Gammaproteobacteria bacterium]